MQKQYQIARMLNRPMAIHRGHMDAILAAVLARGASPDVAVTGQTRPEDKDYTVVEGVAILPIHGVLMQRESWWSWWGNEVSYEWIRQMMLTALADSGVREIVFDIDSPGGMIAGCLDLADTIYAARDVKPLTAILTESAFSAAYALASAANRIFVPRTGGAGHVGAILVHYDVSKMYEEAGVKPTVFTYGERKADGRSEIPLSDEARAIIQAEVDQAGELIVETVARNRGMSVAAVRDTQARTYFGVDAVKIGFADAVAAPDAAFRAVLGL